jgi:hypothetical protein
MIRSILIFILLILPRVILSQTLLASIPLELNQDLAFIKVQINNSDTLCFMFDTDAGGTVIDSATAKRIGLKVSGKINNISSTGTAKAQYSKNNKLKVGNAIVGNISLVIMPLNHLDKSFNKKIDGIIGYDIMKNYVIELKHDSLKLNIYTNSYPEYKKEGKEIPIKLFGREITILSQLTNGKTVFARLIIDTGAMAGARLYSHFVKKHSLIDPFKKYSYIGERGATDHLIENPIDTLKSIRISDFTVQNIQTVLCREKYDTHKVDGLIGNKILNQFNIVIDYKHKKLHLKSLQ